MNHYWNDTETGKPKHSQESLFQSHFNHNKSHTESAGVESGTSLRDANDQPPQPRQGPLSRSSRSPNGSEDAPEAHDQQMTITTVK